MKEDSFAPIYGTGQFWLALQVKVDKTGMVQYTI